MKLNKIIPKVTATIGLITYMSLFINCNTNTKENYNTPPPQTQENNQLKQIKFEHYTCNYNLININNKHFLRYNPISDLPTLNENNTEKIFMRISQSQFKNLKKNKTKPILIKGIKNLESNFMYPYNINTTNIIYLNQ